MTKRGLGGILPRLQKAGISPGIIALFGIMAIVPLFTKDEFVKRVLVLSLYYGAMAMVFDFTAGLINIVNFGFAAFAGLGAYTSALMVINLHISPWLGMVCGALVAMLCGVLVGLLTLRLSGIYAAVLTWFLALALMAVTTAMPELTRGSFGLNVPPLFDTFETGPYLYTLLPMVLIIYLILTLIAHSRIGLAFRGIGQNMAAARASGVNPTLFRVANFTISCAFAGLLGGFYGHFIGILTPAYMDTAHTMDVLALSYVGGRSSLWGGIVAALIFTPTLESIQQLMAWRLVFYGLALVVVMVFWPGGLAAIIRMLGHKVTRLLASRKAADEQGPSGGLDLSDAVGKGK